MAKLARKGKWMAIRVLIVDDHVVVRKGLRRFLEHDPKLKVVGEAVNGIEALEKARDLQPDVILMDLLLPGMDGGTATSIICRELPEIKVIVLTSVLNDASLANFIQAGAAGYLLKDAEPDELRTAIKAATSGQTYLSPQVSTFLMEKAQAPERSKPLLTKRESEVLQFLAQGLDNKTIAQALHIGENTVKTYVGHILTKLGAQSRTQAILVAMRLGLVLQESQL
jgi:two-component system, NarL family, response regulator LiaR